MRNGTKALVVAGEASGDMHAANLVRELKVLRPELTFFGIGGIRMEKAGVELIRSTEELSVVGFTEVLSKLSRIREAMSELYCETVRRRPEIAVFVDYPGFNLRFARLIRGFVPNLFYYIAPQVWAWGGWRARSIPVLFDALISVIPFECRIYEGTGMKCVFVGHPVLDLVNPSLSKEEFRARYCPSGGLLVGIVPGSRTEEVKRILPVMLDSARILGEQVDKSCFAVSVAETIDIELVRSICGKKLKKASLVKGMTYDLMQASELLMVASGTATLEAAVLGAPMSIVYRTSPLTWLLAKGLVKVRSVGLVNIIAEKDVVPEFIQYDARPERIAEQMVSLLKDRECMERMKGDLALVREKLGGPGASKRAAELVAEFSECR